MRIYDLVIATCWLLFFIVWAVLAMVDRGRGGRSSPVRRGVRLLLVVLIGLAIFFGDRLPITDFARASTGAAAATAVDHREHGPHDEEQEPARGDDDVVTSHVRYGRTRTYFCSLRGRGSPP